MRRFGRTLVTAALAVAVVGGTAGWASGDSQSAVTGPPPGSAAWRADTAYGRALPDPATATPQEVARFFAGLDDAARAALVRSHPLVVGNLDGAPLPLRYEANRLAVAATGDARYASLAAPDRRILAFDPRGRGQVAEVFGDLEHAAHVSVIVPGSDNDAASDDARRAPHTGPAGMARALRTATETPAAGGSVANRSVAGGSVAVIAWTGYTTPVGVGLDAADGRLASAGATRLARFTAGLDAVGAPDPVLFCHSYGSVVCGLAARHTDATDVVAFGSPGMRADTAAALHTGARVWAARGPSDWIADVPNVRFAGIGHGADPASAAFGARRVPAADVRGHTGYFTPGTQSLAAFAAIAKGEAAR
ncbi:alpha/beta hydrolase [Streptomyces erythrochromogenes]|uniref:alpha/beta hydrolase n=1 Tax=Streptomyces erythrochromogenes TaxID=285574 RepID=UPI00225387EE|nr:alpha/beta hydrolase [Streptomyces erythrochromogenes]MCX5583643.1 alpha/beta hydrolase family protein [Streptomyces erythrochromogenes]